VPAIIYVLLALGCPLGEFALGGKYMVMPPRLRIVCAASVFVVLFAVMIILQTGGILPLLFSMKTTKLICFIFAAYLSLNTIMNALSNSKKEKYFATPLSVMAAICFWITAFNAHL
jgi:hypothetical protein